MSETIRGIIGQLKLLIGHMYPHTHIAHLLIFDPGRDTQVPLWYYIILILISCGVSIIGGGGGG